MLISFPSSLIQSGTLAGGIIPSPVKWALSPQLNFSGNTSQAHPGQVYGKDLPPNRVSAAIKHSLLTFFFLHSSGMALNSLYSPRIALRARFSCFGRLSAGIHKHPPRAVIAYFF